MDMKHMSHATERSSGLIVSVETPDVPQLPWRMDGGIKEFHLIAEPVKQEIVPGRVIDLWGLQRQRSGPNDSSEPGRSRSHHRRQPPPRSDIDALARI